MCIIIQRPAGAEIPEWRLESSMAANKDGWGIMWSQNGRALHLKGTNMDEFMPIYRTFDGVDIGIHFRWRTHGDYDVNNAHPYTVLHHEAHGSDLLLMHNGVIRVRETNPKMSDTWHWIQEILPYVENDPSIIENKLFWTLVGDELAGSRLLMMDGAGEFLRVGHWVEHEKCFYSNNSFARSKPYQSPALGGAGVNHYPINRPYGSQYGSGHYYGGSQGSHHSRDHGDDDYFSEFGERTKQTPKIGEPHNGAVVVRSVKETKETPPETQGVFSGIVDAVNKGIADAVKKKPDLTVVPKTTAGGQVTAKPNLDDQEALDGAEFEEDDDDEFQFLDAANVPEEIDLSYLVNLTTNELTELCELRPESVAEVLYDLMHNTKY